MKKYIPHIVILIVGIVIGALCREHHFRSIVDNPQRDTIRIKDTRSYGKLNLKTYKLDIPKFNIPRYYYIQYDSTKIEYRDSIKYIVLPSESYHTKLKGVDIYHHGIKSEIDSVNVEHYITEIHETYTPSPKKHTLTFYGAVGYMDAIRLPVGLKYLYHPNKWLGVGGKVERDLLLRQNGVFLTSEITLGW